MVNATATKTSKGAKGEKPTGRPAQTAQVENPVEAAQENESMPADLGTVSLDVEYPQVETVVRDSKNPLTVEEAKAYLGWTEEGEKDNWGRNFLLTDLDGKKIRCVKNRHNRPLNWQWCKQLSQDILNRRWQFNGEAIIIGRYGSVLSGQHRLIAFVLAGQAYKGPKKDHWQDIWGEDNEPTLETVITYGVDEDSSITQTLDKVRRRTLADSLFTSAEIFPKITETKERRNLCRVVEQCVGFLWTRTGKDDDNFADLKTDAEMLSFVDSHPRLLEMVQHVYNHDSQGSISKLLPLGVASACAYLMSASASDPDVYREYALSGREAEAVDLSHYDTAQEFVTYLGGLAKETKAVRDVITDLANQAGGGSTAERVAVFARAWKAYIESSPNKVRKADCQINDIVHVEEKDGFPVRTLTEHPEFDGIDMGSPVEREKARKAQREADKVRRAEEAEERRKAREAETLAKAAAKEAAEKNGAGKNTNREPTEEEIRAQTELKAKIKAENLQRMQTGDKTKGKTKGKGKSDEDSE